MFSEYNRVVILIAAWFCATAISFGAMIFAGSNFLIILVAILAAAYVTSEVMDNAKSAAKPDSYSEKAKRLESDPTGQQIDLLLNLLDEDDIAELRERVKLRLMDNIDTRSDGELSTLDALLAEQEYKSNRGS